MEPEHGEISCNHHHKKRSKTMCAYNCDAHEPTRKRTQDTQNQDHGDHIARKGFHSWRGCSVILCTNLSPYSRHRKFWKQKPPFTESGVSKRGKNLKKKVNSR